MKEFKSKTALVAGGAGFVGSHLCKRLFCCGYNVICIDNLSSGNKENISELIRYDNFKFIEQDVTSTINIREAVDEIYNLACPASPIKYQKKPIQTFCTNVIGSQNLLELAYQKKARILLASTSEVYGEPMMHPQREDYRGNVNPNGIRSCYDEGKRGAETLFCDYNRSRAVDVKIIRIFNTYGPNMGDDDGRVISNFIVQALNNRDVTVYGDGTQTRSFLYVDDLIEGIIRMMHTDCNFVGPVNIGNPHEISIMKLAKKIVELTGSNSKIVKSPLPQDDPHRRCPDISLAQKKLNGWLPQIRLDEGLQKTIKYFRNA
ncbi:MAG: SDR family oxidoreductase [Roseburia sp.]|nr:SDR family oxidoreductase [Roseburia sp.]MCM1419869.1 SDR family oxidoreductase [Bacteroides sp.]